MVYSLRVLYDYDEKALHECTTGIDDTCSKFCYWYCWGCSVETGGKFTADVNDTSCKFSAGVNDTGGKFPPASTTLLMHPELGTSSRIFEKIRKNGRNGILRGLEETEVENLVALSR